jgi:phosphohistidine phosphatase
MHIFLLRHGQAEPQKTTDDARELTEKGEADVYKAVLLSLNELKGLQQIWVSPLVRAQQTANIVARILGEQGINPLLRTTELLVPEASPAALLSSLNVENKPSILLVSHQPLLGKTIDLLGDVPGAYNPMFTSSLAYVECGKCAPKSGRLVWLRHVNE